MAFGQHKMEYEVLEGWEQPPEGWSFVEVAGVAELPRGAPVEIELVVRCN